MTVLTALGDAIDRARFGGKAANLAQAIRAGLPVPAGVALSTGDVATVLRGSGGGLIAAAHDALPGFVAVRSSAIDEDGITVSFAGQHATKLGVRGADAIGAAIVAIVEAAHGAAASVYRARMGTGAARRPTLGIVIQPLLAADVAGVLFTRHPVTGDDQRVIESSFGLGEVVVSGRVEPDRYVVARGGALIEQRVGDKALALWRRRDGVHEMALDATRARAATLDAAHLLALDALATECEQHFGGDQDLEWAFTGEALHLLQWRPITVRRY